jgi:putative FmdB family regulatory protein
MPIYAYRCHACGHAKDVLQKLRDAPLSTCPVCHAETFEKQLTAAGFQLKGSGWYATDFRHPSPGQNAAKEGDDTASQSDAGTPQAADKQATPTASADTSQAGVTPSSPTSNGSGSSGPTASSTPSSSGT